MRRIPRVTDVGDLGSSRFAHSRPALDKWKGLHIEGRQRVVPLVDEYAARSHVDTMSYQVTLHLRLPPEGTDAAGF
jgi:hypothetical protein